MVKEYLINSDTILWNDFIKGNDDAFKVIYNNHIQSLYKFGSHFTHDTDLVKDCIHDVYIELAKYRKSLGTTNNIKLYLFKSLKRKIIKALAVKGNLATIDSENVPFYYTRPVLGSQSPTRRATDEYFWTRGAANVPRPRPPHPTRA